MKPIHVFQKLIAYVDYVSVDPVGRHCPWSRVAGDIEHLVMEIENHGERINFSRSSFDAARFVVYAWVDERLLSSRRDGCDDWSKQTLQYRFFETSAAGVEVFARLGAILSRGDLPVAPCGHVVNPFPRTDAQGISDNEKYWLVDIHARCLGMGFKGCYHDDEASLEAWSKACLDVLSANFPDRFEVGRLFPETYDDIPPTRPRKAGTLWKLAFVVIPALATCAMFVFYDYWLDLSLTAIGGR